MELTPYTFRIDQFTHDRDCKLLIAEHSDLKWLPIDYRLYDNAWEIGCAIRNPKTKSITRWYVDNEKRDVEGELQVTILKPTSETVRKYPQTEGYELHILND